MIGGVNGYGSCEELDGLVIVFGSKCFVALIFEGVCLRRVSQDGTEAVEGGELTSAMCASSRANGECAVSGHYISPLLRRDGQAAEPSRNFAFIDQ